GATAEAGVGPPTSTRFARPSYLRNQATLVATEPRRTSRGSEGGLAQAPSGTAAQAVGRSSNGPVPQVFVGYRRSRPLPIRPFPPARGLPFFRAVNNPRSRPS